MAHQRPLHFSSNRFTGRAPIPGGAEATQAFRSRMTERVGKALGDLGLAGGQSEAAATPRDETNDMNQRTEE